MTLRLFAIALLPMLLGGCVLDEGSEFWKLAPAGGGTTAAPPRTAPTPIAPMLQDPEGQQSSVSDYVWATDSIEAERLCRNLSERWGNEYSHIQRANNWQNKAGKYRYTCFMTNYGEPRNVSPDDNDTR